MAPQNTIVVDDQPAEITDKAILKGMEIASPAPGDEVVISGIAGRFPDSDDLDQFRDNLHNKVDLVTSDNRRWEATHPEIPHRTGKINKINHFDGGFFGIHHRQVQTMDPMCRLILERAVEAIFDAGIHPKELEGTRTGVFVGGCFSETEKTWFYERLEKKNFAITGCGRSMLSNRISYYLKLHGPSYVVDTACSSSLHAFEHAYRAIRNGECDTALVGGTNLCLHPFVSLQFARLGVLSADGTCKSFDCTADGYARSEAVSVVLLQKAKDCRRIYAQVVHAKINCDGYKEQGITYPSGPVQKRLLDEFYQECKVDPSTLSFVEAHGTGTKVGDPEEVGAIDEVFCAGRNKPLLIGSVKSNIGHTEPASGLCSIAKVVIGMESGYIPPNIYYQKPRENVKALENGRVKVVVEKTPWQDDNGLVGINSFGFGGANCHVLLRWNQKQKVNLGQPRDDLPRIVCVSGRSEESVTAILDQLKSRKLDAELVRLYHEMFKYDIANHNYRGYSLVSKTGELSRSLRYYDGEKDTFYFVFGGYDATWLNIGYHLFGIPLFAATLQKLHKVLSPKGINVTDLVMNNKKSTDIVSGILTHVAIQLVLVDILKTLSVVPDFVVGQSIGVLAAAYCDGALTLEQAITCAYHVAFWTNEATISDHLVAEVKMGHEKIKPTLPEGVEVIAEISDNIVIVSGNVNVMRTYLKYLRNKRVSIKEYFGEHVGLHHKHSITLGNKLFAKLAQVIAQPKQFEPKFLATSPVNNKNLASPEFFVGSMTKPVFLKGAIKQMAATKSVVLELGATSIEDALKDELSLHDVIGFTGRGTTNGIVSFMDVLGRLYESGQNPRLERLYPKVQYPVSRGTPMIAPQIKWDHSKDWFVTFYKTQEQIKSGERIIGLSLKEDDWEFLTGHVVDGRNLFPATGYLNLVWETLSMMLGMMSSDIRVVFENVKFLRATTIPKETKLELIVMVQRGSGNFEVIEGGTAVVTGRIYMPDDYVNETLDLPAPDGILEEKCLPLKQRDVYKELKLRGYNYSGLFKSIVECDNSATKGLIQWRGNWIAFMDNMLQMQILQVDTRNLYVPTGIQKMTIDAKRHIAYTQKFGEDARLPVCVYRDSQIIRSGAIEIRGLSASSIARRKPQGEPVLEKYQFVSNVDVMSTKQSLRVNMQIVLENHYSIKIKAVELVDAETKEGSEPLGPTIHEVLADQPLIQPEIVILSKKPLEVINATVEDRKLTNESDCLVVVATNIMSRPQILQEAFAALKPNGFIVSREPLDFDETKTGDNELEILTVHTVPSEKLVMLRKSAENKMPVTVDVGVDNFDWLPTLQTAVKSDNRVVIYAQDRPLSGIIGLLNCIRREPGGEKVQCVYVMDEAPPFGGRDTFYRKQLKKNMAVNVYKDGSWGTYRHLLLDELPVVEREHTYVNVTVRGDLSSLKWLEGPLTLNTTMEPDQTLVSIYYSALNFRDVMTASGRINADVVTMDRIEQDCVQGFEFAGRDQSGRRVMGMVTSKAMTTLLAADSHILWEFPESWSMEDAATVPAVYGTVLYAFFVRTQIKRGESVLIHAGTGGVGQAAISIALHYGCTVFTTVGTKEKREFVKKRFPQLTDRHIGNSRDTSFEQLVLEETNGRGVDYVLNSLAEEKLQASLRCLARGGKFLEIGKFDMASNNSISLQLFAKEASFHGIMVDALFTGCPRMKRMLSDLLTEGVANGSVVPLPRNVFKSDELEQAFRFMAAGKHMGKVLIQVRLEEKEKNVAPALRVTKGIPRYFCDPNHSYIITGGIGGFGLELADWLVLRGCRKLILTSRTGVKNGYQDSRIRTWRSYGTKVVISTANITTKEGCKKVIEQAIDLGPVAAIFNLAVVLKDAILENQTLENYLISFGPKAFATKHLDEISRTLCPQLKDFVIFSSVSCGRGNPGQTNYGMANSVMERICERRKDDGFPALAIEWGAIGEVGLVAEMQEGHTELEIGGTLQQRISSCLETLDIFLRQNEPIVSSMVVAEKRSGFSADNVVDCVANILGLRNLKTISLHSTLAELGMDSMMAVEIKQSLEREFEVFLTPQDIRSMTFARLQEIQEEKESENDSNKTNKPEVLPEGLMLLLRHISKEETANVPLIEIPSSVDSDVPAPTVFMIPGIEGSYNVLENVSLNVKAHVKCLQLCYKNHKNTTHEMALQLLPHIEHNQDKSKRFTLLAYSFGCSVAIELIALLEQSGYVGDAIFVDGSPEMMIQLVNQQVRVDSEVAFETTLLCALMTLYMPTETIVNLKDIIYRCKTYDERIQIVLDNAPKDTTLSREYQNDLAVGLYKRLKAIINYKPSFTKLKSHIKLIRPTLPSVLNIADDYKLSEYTTDNVDVIFLEGNHMTVMENPKVAEEINKIISTSADVPQVLTKSTFLNQNEQKRLHEMSIKQI